jgi:nucleoside-diphosphate-sugar epimerase
MRTEGVMLRVAVLGANGQVGAELCLLLAQVPGIELVPVCRNPTGSAFLRYSGIACRHGRPADPNEAPGLFGDCDVVVNCALGAGTPAEIRSFDRQLIRNMVEYSPPSAVIVHFSTLMIYGDPRPGKLFRFRNAYGRAKFAAESQVKAATSRAGKTAYILRLGHVCGPLQNITDKIRKEISQGQVVLPENDAASNTVYTVTILDALISIMAGKERAGTYDLTNAPQWTWREVYEFEGRLSAQAFSPRIVAAAFSGPLVSKTAIVRWLKKSISRCLSTPAARRSVEKLLAIAPSAINDRAQATWSMMRARAEIGALLANSMPAEELSWIRLDRRTLSNLQPTKRLLENSPLVDIPEDVRRRWPKDLEAGSAMLLCTLAQAQ